jgi:hypothetical protein
MHDELNSRNPGEQISSPGRRENRTQRAKPESKASEQYLFAALDSFPKRPMRVASW